MRTLVTDDFAERPQPYVGPIVTFGPNTLTVGSQITIVTTGGYVAGDPPPPEVYRTQAFVEKHKEITDGNGA